MKASTRSGQPRRCGFPSAWARATSRRPLYESSSDVYGPPQPTGHRRPDDGTRLAEHDTTPASDTIREVVVLESLEYGRDLRQDASPLVQRQSLVKRPCDGFARHEFLQYPTRLLATDTVSPDVDTGHNISLGNVGEGGRGQRDDGDFVLHSGDVVHVLGVGVNEAKNEAPGAGWTEDASWLCCSVVSAAGARILGRFSRRSR